MKKLAFLFFLFTVILLPVNAQKKEVLHFIVESGTFQRINTPVSVDIETITKSDTLSFQLFEKINGQMVEKPFQIESGYTP